MHKGPKRERRRRVRKSLCYHYICLVLPTLIARSHPNTTGFFADPLQVPLLCQVEVAVAPPNDFLATTTTVFSPNKQTSKTVFKYAM